MKPIQFTKTCFLRLNVWYTLVDTDILIIHNNVTATALLNLLKTGKNGCSIPY